MICIVDFYSMYIYVFNVIYLVNVQHVATRVRIKILNNKTIYQFVFNKSSWSFAMKVLQSLSFVIFLVCSQYHFHHNFV